MITTDKQLTVANKQADLFRVELARAAGKSQAIVAAGLRSQLDDIRREIEEYVSLRDGETTELELASLDDLPSLLIRARIALNLTQRELADRIGLKEQQIQRYERQIYQGVSFSRVAEIARALGIRLPSKAELLEPKSRTAILERLGIMGMGREFVLNRIAPTGDGIELARRLGYVFDWKADEVLEGALLSLPTTGGATVRFKLPKGRSERSVSIFTAYAHRLAELCAETRDASQSADIPIEASEMIDLINQKGKIDFTSALETAWDLGVIVLPLSDRGSFHGACWRIEGVNVIVLKQSEQSAAKWLIDLLHELFHAGRFPELRNFEIVEEPETSDVRREDQEEIQATWFANLVASRMGAEDLFAKAIERANGDLRRLKQSTIKTAEEASIDVGVLANYTAYRLSMQGTNWWGTAANLQDRSVSPLEIARNVFFDRFDFSKLTPTGFDLLKLALNDEVDNG